MKRTALYTLFFFLCIAPALAAETSIYRGQLGESQIFIARPARYSGNMLIIAHGLRAEFMPLTADLNLQEPFYRELLKQGWLIASTSYRRNGVIIEEAIRDIMQLRDFAAEQYGRPETVFLMGTSMGGAIGLKIAESAGSRFKGMVCMGAALFLCRSFTGSPRVPVLFLSNQNEAAAPRTYIEALKKNAVRPALWLVGRDGHCNINDEEKLTAFRALVDSAGKGAAPGSKTITIALPPAASSAEFSAQGACAAIGSVDPVYGNLHTRFVRADFEKLGIKKGDTFMLQAGGREQAILLGASYEDVPQGGLVAFFMHDGSVQIARNLMNAAELLGCVAGDRLCVLKAKPVRPENPDHRR